MRLQYFATTNIRSKKFKSYSLRFSFVDKYCHFSLQTIIVAKLPSRR